MEKSVFEAQDREYSKGVCLIILSTLSFSVTASLVKANTAVPAVEIGFLRAICSIVVAYLSCKVIFKEPFLPTGASQKTCLLLMFRGLVDVMASNLFYFGCTHVSLGLATVIMFTSPFWAGLVSWAWLGEIYTAKDFFLACLAFVGVVLTAAPELQNSQHVSIALVLLILPCGLLQGITYCAIKRVAADCHFMQMTSSYGVCGLLFCSSFIFTTRPAQTVYANTLGLAVFQDFDGLSLAVLASVFGVAAQVLLSVGCAKVNASLAASIRTLDIPLSIVIQAFFFGHGAQAVEIFGACLVVVTCMTLATTKVSDQGEKWLPMPVAKK